jgi:hypothetical protein
LAPPGGGELHLWSEKHFTEPAAVTNDLVLPDEYQDAVVWNLTCRMAAEFIGDPTPYQMAMANVTFTEVAALNQANDPAESYIEVSDLNRGHTTYDIDGG